MDIGKNLIRYGECQNTVVENNNGAVLYNVGSNCNIPNAISKYEINPINIFPNPIDENLYINLDRQYKNAVVSIVDVNGNYDNIYDFIREPLKGHENEKNNKSAIKNLEYIKQHFEKLGYKSIVQKITNDMQDA